MAKPKFPKKSNSVKEPVSSTITPSNFNITTPPVEVASAAPAAAEVAQTETQKTESKKAKTARKPEIVKTESRANLVPINLEEEIRRLAYLFSERRGFEAGHETEDWVNAEREIRQRYHQHSA